MSYIFLLPLLVAVVTAYAARNSNDEIAYLTTLVALGSLLLSLILAPWQIQLLILIAVVAIVAVLWGRRERETTETPVAETAGDKKYRGVAYTEIHEEAIEGEQEGKYRGASVKISHTPSIAPPIRPSALKYRGASVDGDEVKKP
jgi:membrane protein implicated in regulation of membrane protease activity